MKWFLAFWMSVSCWVVTAQSNPFIQDIEIKDLDASVDDDYNIWVDIDSEDNAKDIKVWVGNSGDEPANGVRMKVYQSHDPFYDDSDLLVLTDEFDIYVQGEKQWQPWEMPFYFDMSDLDTNYEHMLFVLEAEGELTTSDNQRSVRLVRTKELGHDLFFYKVWAGIAHYYPFGGEYPIGVQIDASKREKLWVEVRTFFVDDVYQNRDPILHDVGFYFSKDSRFSKSEDLELMIDTVRAHWSEETDHMGLYNLELSLDKVEDREGYLIVMIDPYNKLDEYTRINNSIAFPMTVSHVFEPLPYPNPFDDQILLKDIADHYELYDLLGKKIMEGKKTDKINTAHVMSGVYLLKIEGESLFKLVKR